MTLTDTDDLRGSVTLSDTSDGQGTMTLIDTVDAQGTVTLTDTAEGLGQRSQNHAVVCQPGVCSNAKECC